MPRRGRLSIPGIQWHIVQRGNNRGPCFFAPEDYRYYLDLLKKASRLHQCAVHAYVLMTNHVHLLLTPHTETSAAKCMKAVAQMYTQFINRKYDRTGRLWEGRFKSCLTRDEHYVLICYRYIELNPVRAGMVSHPREYRWSSYRANGEGVADSIVTRHEHYLGLGSTDDARRETYRQLLASALDETALTGVRTATSGNYVLGSRSLQDEIARTSGRPAKPGRAGRPRTMKVGNSPHFP